MFSMEFGLTFAILFFKGHREAQERLEPLMTKIDFRKTQKALYLPSAKTIELIDVPPRQYAMIDGKGPPRQPHLYRNSWVAISYQLWNQILFQT